MKKIILCPNLARDNELKITRSVCELLDGLDCEYTVYPVPSNDLSLFKEADFVITFGGDGTILHTARAAARYGVPVIGVNLGHKGFIAELEKCDIALIKKIAAGDFELETRMMEDVAVERSGEVIYTDYAFNDVVIGSMAKICRVTVYGDGKKISSFSGDGIVVATPTGSTAYSLSAGGPIVEPETENIIVTPICPHVLWAKSYVLSADRTVTIEIGDVAEKVAYLSADGGNPVYLLNGDKITVTKSPLVTKLVRLSERSFYEKVSEKLGEK